MKAILVFLTYSLFDSVASLECVSCENVNSTSRCFTRTCGDDEQCYTSVTGTANSPIYNLGCRPHSQCSSFILIGRGTDESAANEANAMMPSKRGDPACDLCCPSDFCNRRLCIQTNNVTSVLLTTVAAGAATLLTATTMATTTMKISPPTTVTTGSHPECIDNPAYNCELIASTFNICKDIQHAKTVCKKFCGLCDLVDGMWGSWTEWSMCQQTCGDSHRIRLRKCDNPTPSGGGSFCEGNSTVYKDCSGPICPVHGKWSEWTDWSPCTVSCGIGLNRRNRSCNNPYPAHGGDHCFGDPAQYRVCYGSPCRNGGWSGWSQWSTCTATCDGGLQSRTRICNSPSPSLLGAPCSGHSIGYTSCNSHDCTMNTASGTTDAIYFSVSTPTGRLLGENSPEFSKVIINEGKAYNLSTGQFIVPINGIYEFSIIFITSNSDSQCVIRQNRTTVVYALTHSEHNGWKTASASTYVRCNAGDVIDLACGGWQYVDHNASTMFSGAMVHAD